MQDPLPTLLPLREPHAPCQHILGGPWGASGLRAPETVVGPTFVFGIGAMETFCNVVQRGREGHHRMPWAVSQVPGT